uniref:Chaperonin 60 subunit alpha 2ic-like n=1 Tax=Rhizophora mucronata TaxID=61149 RepID=A0A2P2JDY9_RHIMU
MASASKFPIKSSFPAETVATAFMFSLPITARLFFFKTFTNSITVISIPFRKEMGLAPKATARSPILIIARAKIIAVVVPSPAKSFILLATSWMSIAPAFSIASESSIA